MPDRINIPVTVTGAAEAQAQLRGVAAGVQEVGEAGAAAAARIPLRDAQGRFAAAGGEPGAAGPAGGAAAQGAIGEAEAAQAAIGAITGETGRAAEATAGLTRQGRALVGSLLSLVHPALGGTVILLSNIVRGIGAITTGLFAFAGGAAVLGGLILFFREMAAAATAAKEAIERAEQARREAREAGGGERERIRAAAGAVGLYGDTAAIQQNARAMQETENLLAAVAENVALAQILARRRQQPFDPSAYLAGIVAAGGEIPKLKGQEALATIQQTIARGAAPEAQAAARVWKWELAQEPPTAPAPGGERISPLDAARAARRHEMQQRGLMEKEIEAVGKIVAELPAELAIKWKAAMTAAKKGIVTPSWWSAMFVPEIEEQRAGLGGRATVGELIDWAREVRAQTMKRGRSLGAPLEPDSGLPRPTVPTTQPITINVHNDHRQTTSIDSGYLLGVSPDEAHRAYEVRHEGAGIEN